MTRIRTLFVHSALVAALALGAAHAAHAAGSSSAASVGAASGNGNGNGNGGNSADGAGSMTNNGGNGPDVFAREPERPNRPRHPRPPLVNKKPCIGASCKVQTASVDGKVCFYTGVNFTGAHFCASIGTSAPRLPVTWNDRISSVQVIGPASVKICSDRAYSGSCLALGSSRGALISLDNATSSFAVMR